MGRIPRMLSENERVTLAWRLAQGAQLYPDHVLRLRDPIHARETLCELRRLAGMRVEPWARSIGVTRQHAYSIEAGDYLPSHSLLFSMAHAVRYDVALVPQELLNKDEES